MVKGISTIIVIILLVIIVIALIFMLWLFASGLFTSTTAAGKASIENTTYRMMGCLRIISVNPKNGEITLRNCGNVPISNCNVFVDNAKIISDSRTIDPNSIFSIALSLTVGVYDIFVACDNAESMHKTVEIVSTVSPQWFDSYVNSTSAGSPVLHSLRWTSNVGLSGYIFSFDNCMGSLTNDSSWVPMTGMTNWSNVTKTISSTVGCTIQWQVYANDTSNRWSASDVFSYPTSNGGGPGPQPPSCDFHISSLIDTYTIDKNNKIYCLDNDVSIDGKTVISFASGVQNTTLDCLNYNINSNKTSNTYGVYLTGASTINNTVKNCNITNFYYGINLQSGSSSNNILNNTLNSFSNCGIYLSTNSKNNILINNMISGSSNYGIYLLSAYNNTMTNNTANSNNVGIMITSSSNNTLTNNTAYSNSNYGIWLSVSSNNTITKNTASNNVDTGIYLSNSANNNQIINSIANNNSGGIWLWSSSNNIFTNDTINNNNNGINLYSSFNNTITGGSIVLSSIYDYYFSSVGTTNNFTNTNFTAARIIYFYDANSWFNYNNETTGNIWLKTNVPAQTRITRKLVNWNNTLQWNDTSDTATTARYNITGLLTNTNYSVYNNTIPVYTLNSGSNGEISFTINLPINQEIELKVERTYCDYYIFNSNLPYTIINSNNIYCLAENVHIDGKTAINFSSGIQNSTLDCRSYNIDGNNTTSTYGINIYNSGVNNTIKNCYITNFYYGLANNKSNSNTITNLTTCNSIYGIYLVNSNNNNFTDITAINSTKFGIIISMDVTNYCLYNKFMNIRVYNNTNEGIRIVGYQTNYNTLANVTVYNSKGPNIDIISHYNTLTDVTVYNSENQGIFFWAANHNVITNLIAYNNRVGLQFYQYSNDTIIGGSIFNNTNDYKLGLDVDLPSKIINTNFTDARKINFTDLTSWFIYSNDTGSIWLKTNVSAAATITRKLVNWNQNLMQWNDTSDTAVTAIYNVSGLLTNTNYSVYNNTLIPTYILNSSLQSEINFTIYLPLNQQINITVQKV